MDIDHKILILQHNCYFQYDFYKFCFDNYKFVNFLSNNRLLYRYIFAKIK